MKGRLVVSIVLIVVGLAWIFDIAGARLFPGGLSRWWPGLLILIGVVQLALSRGEWRAPAVLIVVGAGLLAWTLGLLPRNVWAYVAPLALIAVGVLLLLPSRPTRSPPPPPRPDEATRPNARLGPEDVAIFSERRLEAATGTEYRGGEVTAVFGTLHADLRGAKLPPEGARLKATGVFGSVRLQVPPDWRVEMRGTPVGGRTEDRTTPGSGARLDVEAVTVFGSVEVSN